MKVRSLEHIHLPPLTKLFHKVIMRVQYLFTQIENIYIYSNYNYDLKTNEYVLYS